MQSNMQGKVTELADPMNVLSVQIKRRISNLRTDPSVLGSITPIDYRRLFIA